MPCLCGHFADGKAGPERERGCAPIGALPRNWEQALDPPAWASSLSACTRSRALWELGGQGALLPVM